MGHIATTGARRFTPEYQAGETSAGCYQLLEEYRRRPLKRTPLHAFMIITAGAARHRMRRYGRLTGSSSALEPMRRSSGAPNARHPAVQRIPQLVDARIAWLCSFWLSATRRRRSASLMAGAPGELVARTLVTDTPMKVKTWKIMLKTALHVWWGMRGASTQRTRRQGEPFAQDEVKMAQGVELGSDGGYVRTATRACVVPVTLVLQQCLASERANIVEVAHALPCNDAAARTSGARVPQLHRSIVALHVQPRTGA